MRRAHRASVAAIVAAAGIGFLTACGSTEAAEETTESASVAETVPADDTGVIDAADAAVEESAATTAASEPDATIDTAIAEEDPVELADGEVPMGVMMGETDEAPALSVNWEQMDGVIGWLVIPGAEVSAGIYESENDDNAWIDPNNYPDYTDPDTVIHGASADGQVMHGVLRYEDGEVYEANREIYVYTPDGQVLTYRIFAAYEADTEDILIAHPSSDYESFETYVSGIYGVRAMGAHLDTEMESEVLGTWQMLTVQASDGDGSDYILQATLTGNGLSES